MKDIALSFPGIEKLYSEPHEERGIIHSEMAIILGMCQKLGIDIVIESGRHLAQSTYILAKYLPETKIISIEKGGEKNDIVKAGIARVSHFSNLTLLNGMAHKVIPKIKVKKGAKVAHCGVLTIGSKT